MGMTCTGIALGIVFLTCDGPPQPVTDTARFCQTVEAPVKYSRSDTELTRRQLRGLNAKWRTLCQGVADAPP